MSLNLSMHKIFEGAAGKYLSEVDANPKKSHQHEIGGLVKVGFKQILGGSSERIQLRAKMLYLDDDEGPEIVEDAVTWYDTRANDSKRNAEYRLYYPSNSVTLKMKEGDFFLIAKLLTQELLIAICPAGTTHESQLRALFGLAQIDDNFTAAQLSKNALSLPLIYLLEELGYQPEIDQSTNYLEKLISKFGDKKFPSTAEFSAFAREISSVGFSELPDTCIMAWLETEEMLFRTLEKYFVAQRLNEGFGHTDEQVNNFISYSLSVQNRRKARAGLAFEKHLESLFQHHNLKFEQGSSKLFTENKKKPDFIFPSFSAYHDQSFPTKNIRLLGAKTTCKDRWRQVLSEGKRAELKHLITLEPSISNNQLEEMKSNNLQLVIPAEIHSTYQNHQQSWLLNLEDFIKEVKAIQTTYT